MTQDTNNNNLKEGPCSIASSCVFLRFLVDSFEGAGAGAGAGAVAGAGGAGGPGVTVGR